MTDGLPVSPRCRVIVDNDYQGDPDGLVALAHHLLSPSNRVAAIMSSSSIHVGRSPRRSQRTARSWPVNS
jgi:hypothetical protein